MDLKKTIKTTKGFPKELVEIAKAIKKSKKIAILGHKNPDMDCIGSQLALALALAEFGKIVYPLSNGPFTAYLEEYKQYFIETLESPSSIDLYLIVDTSSLDRIGNNFLPPKEKMALIDHHFTNEKFAKINYIDSNFISATELVFLLLTYMNYDFKNKIIVQILLDGILSDNGYYKHIRTEKYDSLLITYFLTSFGGDPKLSYDKMFSNNTVEEIQLLGKVLGRVRTTCNDKIIYTYSTEEDANYFHTELSSLLLFKELTSIKKGQIYLYFKVNSVENKVTISFRAEEGYDVGSVAFELGGGGHKVAAGVTLSGDYEEIKNEILDKVKSLISTEER